MQIITLVVGDMCQTNCYIVYDDTKCAVVIDPGDDAVRIMETVRAHDLSVEAVLLTHNHFDHIMAADTVLKQTGAKLYAFGADAEALSDPARVLLYMSPYDNMASLTADYVLADNDTVTVGDMTFRVMHTPGHTPGSCCYIAGDVMFSGDTLFENSIGRMDFVGGSPRDMLLSVRKLYHLTENYTVYPGHGPATTLLQEKYNNPYMRKHGN